MLQFFIGLFYPKEKHHTQRKKEYIERLPKEIKNYLILSKPYTIPNVLKKTKKKIISKID